MFITVAVQITFIVPPQQPRCEFQDLGDEESMGPPTTDKYDLTVVFLV